MHLPSSDDQRMMHAASACPLVRNLSLEVVHDNSTKAVLISELPDNVSSNGERTSTPILAFSFTNWSPSVQVVGRKAKGENLEDN